MYLSFYDLKENPFQISTNPHFLWLGEKHQEALATLRYGIIDNKGFLLLTGDVGTGKTTLINALLASLEKDVVVATVPDPGLDHLDFYYYLAVAFGLDVAFSSKAQFLVRFSNFLHEAHERGKKVLLVIDEAQRLPSALLEEVRLLSNIEKPEAKLINIFFVGQIEFNSILLRPENRALRQRITVHYDISPLSLEEVDSYLQHRLAVAGATRSLFSPEAVRQIYLYSGGYPRLINVIADRALLTGFVSEAEEIGVKIVLECARELQIHEPRLASRQEEISAVEKKVSDAAAIITSEDAQERLTPSAQTAGKDSVRPKPEENAGDFAAPLLKKGHRDRRLRNKKISLLLVAFFLMAAVVVGCFYFYSRQMQKAAADIEKSAFSIFDKAYWFRFAPSSNGKVLSRPEARKNGVVESSGFGEKEAETGQPSSRQGSKASANQGGATKQETPDDKISLPDGKENAAEADTAQGRKEKAGVEQESEKRAGYVNLGGDKVEAQPRVGENREEAFPKETFGAINSGKPYVIGFRYNSSNLSRYGAYVLDRLVAQLAAQPYSRIVVRGYSDSSGSKVYNQNISLFRASIVKSYLMAKGVKPENIETVGLGEADPVASNETEEGRRKNRRVEIEVRF